MANLPRLRMASDRKNSIIDDSPAIFEIVDNPNGVSAAPFYEIEEASEVVKWCGIIIHLSQKHGVDRSGPHRLDSHLSFLSDNPASYAAFCSFKRSA
jgi:hypothetical protein